MVAKLVIHDEKVIELTKSGLGCKAIAKELGISVPTLCRIRSRLNLVKRRSLPPSKIPVSKEDLEKCINLGYGETRIAKALNKSRHTINYWLKVYQLKTIHPNRAEVGADTAKIYRETLKTCENCLKNKIRLDMKCCGECRGQVTTYALKKAVADSFGGKCSRCGYNEYSGALEFHHINPEEKDFLINHVSFSNVETLKKELKKCELLCSNCHKVIHSKIENYQHSELIEHFEKVRESAYNKLLDDEFQNGTLYPNEGQR